MKNLSLILVLFLITNIGFCQLSIPVTNFKCSAQKSYSLLQSRNNSSDLTQKYDVKFYWHNPEMYLKSQMLKGHTTIRAEVTATQLDTFAFELSDTFTIDSIIYTKNQLPFSRNHDVVFVKLTTALNKGNVFDITIYYHGNTDLSTIDKNWHFPVTFTDSQPYDAIFFFPCKMDLEDKADSVWMFITTSSDCKAGANGLLTKITNLGNGKLRYEWKTKYPTDYYLVAAAVSKYVEYNIWAHPSMTSDSVLVQNFVYDTTQTIGTFTFSCLGLNKAYINNTKYYLELYSDLFGLYPFFKEKYGHCMVALSGAMENQTMTFKDFLIPKLSRMSCRISGLETMSAVKHGAISGSMKDLLIIPNTWPMNRFMAGIMPIRSSIPNIVISSRCQAVVFMFLQPNCGISTGFLTAGFPIIKAVLSST